MFKAKVNSFFNKPKRKKLYSKDFIVGKHIPKSYGIIKQEDINILYKSTPMSLVVGDYVKLKKIGNNYGGRCPFCKTFTNNNYHFKVNDKKMVYKCFECGTGGCSVARFLMIYYNQPFDVIMNFINKQYHNNKLDLRIEGKVVNKEHISDEDLPF